MKDTKRDLIKETEKLIAPLLLKNRFIKTEKHAYANEYCGVVVVTEEGYEVANNNGDVMYFNGHLIYTLIGYLTYTGFMDKNYNQ